MPRAKKTKKPPVAASPESRTPPPVAEQKRQRQKDASIVPSAPYLLASKFLDVSCGLPILSHACPSEEEGGWRSKLPDPEWGAFPHGKLSHSFVSHREDVAKDITFREYRDARSTSGGSAGLRDYYDFAFRTDDTTLGDLSHPSSLCVVLLLVLVLRVLKGIFLPKFSSLGRRLGRAAHGPGWENDNADRVVKFGEYVYRLLFHTSVSLYGLWCTSNEAWWDPARGGTTNLWIDHGRQLLGPGLAWYFLVQCAYNADALMSLLELSLDWEWVNPLAYSSAIEYLEREHVVDERQRKAEVRKMMAGGKRSVVLWTPFFQLRWSATARGDFPEMLAHHLLSNALIFGSAYYRFMRLGSMVFLVHDLSDVPIDLSKLANFVKWKATTIACFVVMVLSWIVMRLYLFPFVLCRSVFMESYEYLVLKGNMDPAVYRAYFGFFAFLLVGLVFLHAVWFLILLRIGLTLVSKGETHDYSEHKSGEDKKDS